MDAKGQLIADVRKIAVLRANALGDFIIILPALEALKAAYPQAEIVLLAKQWHADFLANRPGPIDRVLVVPPSRGVNEEKGWVETEQSRAELDRFLGAMPAEHFDLALQLHGGGRNSNPLLLKLGARVSAGLKTPDAVPLDRNVPYVLVQPEMLRYLEVVSTVGAKPVVLEPRLTVTAADLAEAAVIIPEGDKPLVALHPGASEERRRWPAEQFAALGDALTEAGASVVVTGTPGEAATVEAVVSGMQHPAQNLCGLLSLNGLAGLYSRCKLVVSNDTGPLHLAAAVGAATVGIYWCVSFINWGPVTRTRHRPVLAWTTLCPICHQPFLPLSDCQHTTSLVESVALPEVEAAALALLKWF